MAQSPTNVRPLPAEEPRYSLVQQLLEATPPELAARFVQGWTTQPEGCDPSGAEAVDCGSSTGQIGADPAAGPANMEGSPVLLWALDACSTFGFFARDWDGRVRRQLAAHQSYDLAAQLWDGATNQVEGLGNLYFAAADTPVVTSTAAAVGKALGCLEAALATGLAGGLGMIHITPQALMHAVTMQVVRMESGTWRTPMGTPVIADAGYFGAGPGNVPAGDTQWAYATPKLAVYLAPIDVRPGSVDDREQLAASMNIATNDVVVRAERLAIVQWANECVLAAAELDLPVCGSGQGS